MTQRACDVLIIGGGMLGSACAAALTQRGAQVMLIDAGAPTWQAAGAHGATAAGMGHLVVMDDNPAELALSNWSCQLWRELVQNDPAAHEYSRCGTLWVAADDEEMQAAHLKQTSLLAHGVRSRLLDSTALYEAEAQLAPGLAGGLLVEDDAIVYAPKSAALLMQRAQQSGRLQFRHACATELVMQGEQAIGARLQDGSILSAGSVLVANGMGAAQLLPELPLRAKKGHIVITDRYPGFVRHQLVELGYIKSAHASDGDSVAFNVQPRPSGQMMIGSSRQYDQADTALDWSILRKMLLRACAFLPQLTQLQTLRCWSGVRCASPDGLPLLGPHPTRRNVWLACGHEGLGITTAPASAELIADAYLGNTGKIALQPYLAQRFATLRQAA